LHAVIYKGPRAIALEDRPKPARVNASDVVVKIEATGICGTDRNIFLGNFRAKPGVILGHESVGVVDEVSPDVKDLGPGDRVIINPTLHCGRCWFCRCGELNFCDHKAGTEVGVDMDGTFAEFAVLPAEFLHKIPEPMSFDQALLVEPLACVINNTLAAGLCASDDVAIVGAGPIGVLFGLFAERVALRVTLIESDSFRLSFARARFERVVDDGLGDTAARVIAQNGGRKPRVVVDTTGVMLEGAVELVSKGGRIVLMGFNAGYTATVNPLYLVNNGIRIIGAGDYNSHIFPTAIDVASRMKLEELITHSFPLAEHDEAFRLLVRSAAEKGSGYGAMKVVLRSA
jgi:2-desacetyl-2-hydroxyethyl bacteriochlorophyllide A dehydrogenase